MRHAFVPAVIAVWTILPTMMSGAPGLMAPKVSVGRNLQTAATVRLTEASPQPGVALTLTSDDPSRLLFSKAPDQRGSASITLTVMPRFIESPEFWLQGFADNGTVTYSVTAAGIGSIKGTVTLVPSAVVITGPFRLPSFMTTPRSAPTKIVLVSAALDASLKVAEEQTVAGGTAVEINIKNSNPQVGVVGASKLTIAGGTSVATTYFQPAETGKSTLTPTQAPGFTTAAEWATVTAAVDKPGVAIVDDIYLGKDLQTQAVLCLGEPAPPEGLSVTLTSSDGSKLALSAREDLQGSASITLSVPAGQLTATYYLQGIGDSGEVTYTATAPGYRSRAAKVGLAPSGLIVAYERYGPPDEASVLRKHGADEDERRFYVSVSDTREHPIHVRVWTVHLGIGGRGADITVQPLRAGVTTNVILKSSNPAVATVESPLVMVSGASHVISKFTALRKGETVISVDTPATFTRPKNATSAPATVID